MDDGYDVRYGGLGLQQFGTAVTQCKLDPKVANLMKVLCSREIYRYALMEIGLDAPDLPMGMLSEFHTRKLSACPSYDEIKKLPNKVLLWCGTRSSNLLRHLHKGFLPAVCSLPVAGYMFGEAIVCSDAAAEANRYRFTAVDRPKGFLLLVVASLGDKTIKISVICGQGLQVLLMLLFRCRNY